MLTGIASLRRRYAGSHPGSIRGFALAVKTNVPANAFAVAVFPIAHTGHHARYRGSALGKTVMVFVSIVAGRLPPDWGGSLCAKPLQETSGQSNAPLL